jgi:hypothetical protein
MIKKKKEYVYILNFETGTIDCLSLENRPEDTDAEQFIEQTLDYNLSNCDWMVVDKKLKINYLN